MRCPLALGGLTYLCHSLILQKGPEARGMDHGLLKISAAGSEPIIPHGNGKDWESLGSCSSSPRPPLTSHKAPNHDSDNVERHLLHAWHCPKLLSVSNLHKALGSTYCHGIILWGKLRREEVLSLCGGSHVASLMCYQYGNIGCHWGLASWSSAFLEHGHFLTRRKKDPFSQCSLSSTHCAACWSLVQALRSCPEALDTLPLLLLA